MIRTSTSYYLQIAFQQKRIGFVKFVIRNGKYLVGWNVSSLNECLFRVILWKQGKRHLSFNGQWISLFDIQYEKWSKSSKFQKAKKKTFQKHNIEELIWISENRRAKSYYYDDRNFVHMKTFLQRKFSISQNWRIFDTHKNRYSAITWFPPKC